MFRRALYYYDPETPSMRKTSTLMYDKLLLVVVVELKDYP